MKPLEEILDSEHQKFVNEKGISSIYTTNFPSAYKEQALAAMREGIRQALEEFREKCIACDNSFYGHYGNKIELLDIKKYLK
jgi:hypothetical protein